MAATADRTLRLIITASSAAAAAAFEETAVAADASTARIGGAAEEATSKMGGYFSKFGVLAAGVVPGADAAFGSIGSKIDETSGKVGGFAGALASVPVPVVAIGAAVLGVAAIAAKLGVGFDEQTQKIAANAGISTKAANSIGSAFLATGATVTFSGDTMAAAYASVAGQLGQLNGGALNAKQAMDVMTPSMDLAEASGSSLNSAISDVTTVLQSFGMGITSSGQVSDILYNAANKSGVSIDTLTSSLTKAHTQMGAFAPSVGDLSGLLLDLESHGESGRGALSSLSSMFTSIISPTAAITKAQKDLGVSFINAKTGGLDPLSQIFDELAPKLAGMGNAQAVATLKSLGFGSASQKLASTIEAGGNALDLYTLSVAKSGSASDAANKNTDTFSGAWDKVSKGIGKALTQLGTQLAPILTQVGNDLAKTVTWITDHWPQIQATFTKVFNAIKPVIDGFLTQAQGIIKIISGIVSFVTDVFHGKWEKAWGDIQKIFAGVVQVIKGKVDGLLAPFKLIEPTLKKIWADVSADVTTAWNAVVNFFTQIPHRLLAALGDVVATIGGAFSTMGTWIDTNVLTPVVNFFTRLPDRLLKALGDVVTYVWSVLTSSATWVDTNVLQPVVGFFAGIPKRFLDALAGIVATVWADLSGSWTWIDTNAIEPIVNFFKGIPGGLAGAITGIVGTVWADLSGSLTWIQTNVTTPILNFFGGIGKALGKAMGDVASAISGPFDTAFDAVKKLWNDTIGGFGFTLPSWIPGVGGDGFHIPMMASGGIVPATPGGMLAILGEGGQDEAVIPLGNGGGGGKGLGNGGSGNSSVVNNFTINLNGATMTPQDLVNKLRVYMQQAGSLAAAGIR